ncbi:hypothetical protein GMORB2_6372 [Geosmithia morbida]|uniref:Pentatricopeptide repeat domain-containing protein n=1 Tax=Geosmithia morbida TaxID=1094350 RepID=A0A9P4YXQ7_9HYPO|nr:uncharacterized protein GMORB2_6372 [Geosmithia morbida]KAF4123671.1 hypothetical protein GMORB2_6372 [Geosmithia morbida]
MNALWSRASQAHRCGCRACKTVAQGASRRVTTAPASRRKVTFADVFTACYSSMFASAAVIDAIRKEDRRGELDRQLDEVRRELADLRGQGQAQAQHAEETPVESSVANLTDSQMAELWRSLAAIYHGRPHFKEIHKPALLRESRLRERLQEELYRCGGPLSGSGSSENDASTIERLERALELEEDGDDYRAIRRRDPKERIHLRRSGDGISRLVEGLMTKAASRPRGAQPSPSFDEAARLLEEGYPRYTFRSIDPDTAHSNTQMLNRANKSAIHDGSLGLREMIGRVCYNLLISAYPPDMQSLNTLIVAFDRHRDYRPYSESVIATFFWRSRLMPTPATYPAILHHHRVTGNHGMFLRTLACVAGQDSKTGAKVGRRSVGDIVQDPGLLQRWATDPNRRSLAGDYVWEHAPINGLMVEEVLRGLVRFHMYDHAMALLGCCVSSGVRLGSGLVSHVLDGCLAALDWRGAVTLIRELCRRADAWSSLLDSRDSRSAAYLVGRVYCLLDMVGLGASARSVSDHRLASLGISCAQLAALTGQVHKTAEALPASLAVSPPALARAGLEGADSESRLLQIESLDKELTRVRKTTKSIESRMIKPDLALRYRVSIATHASTAALEASERLQAEFDDVLLHLDGSGQQRKREQQDEDKREPSTLVIAQQQQQRQQQQQGEEGEEGQQVQNSPLLWIDLNWQWWP